MDDVVERTGADFLLHDLGAAPVGKSALAELLIVRHGQSVADVEGRHEGRADFPLTTVGRWQAKQAACWIAREYPPGSIISSPLRRAAETAEIIAAELGLPVVFDDALMERDKGTQAARQEGDDSELRQGEDAKEGRVGDRGQDEGSAEIAGDEDRTARETICPNSGGKGYQKTGKAAGGCQDGHLQGGGVQNEHGGQGQGEQGDLRAEDGDGLPGPHLEEIGMMPERWGV